MKNPKVRISLVTGIIAGLCTDGILRLTSGTDGNLLIHSAVFLIGGAIAAGAVYGGLSLYDRIKKRSSRQ